MTDYRYGNCLFFLPYLLLFFHCNFWFVRMDTCYFYFFIFSLLSPLLLLLKLLPQLRQRTLLLLRKRPLPLTSASSFPCLYLVMGITFLSCVFVTSTSKFRFEKLFLLRPSLTYAVTWHLLFIMTLSPSMAPTFASLASPFPTSKLFRIRQPPVLFYAFWFNTDVV